MALAGSHSFLRHEPIPYLYIDTTPNHKHCSGVCSYYYYYDDDDDDTTTTTATATTTSMTTTTTPAAAAATTITTPTKTTTTSTRTTTTTRMPGSCAKKAFRAQVGLDKNATKGWESRFGVELHASAADIEHLNIGALIIRIRNPENSISNYLGPY